MQNCTSCILLTNKNAKNPIGVDHKNILIGLALKKYVYEKTGATNIPLCMQLIKPESKQHFFSSLSVPSTEDQIIIVEEIKMNLMSKSCFAPGIINFISNLVTSSAYQGDMEQVWLRQYAEGMAYEIYRIKLSYKLENKTFSEVAAIIYKHNRSIAFGIEVQTSGKSIVRLNPSDFKINNILENDIYVYVIQTSPKVAEEIETLEMTKEEINRYYN